MRTKSYRGYLKDFFVSSRYQGLPLLAVGFPVPLTAEAAKNILVQNHLDYLRFACDPDFSLCLDQIKLSNSWTDISF